MLGNAKKVPHNLKVLMIAPTPFFADRGCHVRIYEEIRALQKLGCRVVLTTYHNGRDMAGIETERSITIPWYKKLEAGPSWQKPFLDILLLVKSIRIARKFKPHLIHAHLHEGAFIGIFLKKIFRLPLVFDYQGSMTAEMADHGFVRKGVLFSLFRSLEYWIDRQADLIIPSSTGAGEALKTRPGMSKDKVLPIPDGVDADDFKPGLEVSDLRKSLIIPTNRKIVAYLGLLNRYQGVDLLINCIPAIIKKFKDVHFLVMGYPDVDKYRQMAAGLGISDHVTFTGKIDYSEAPRYLCLGDIALSAKLSKTEANGKIYNFMAAGLPTVCFDTPVNREILVDLGVYVPFGDGKALSSAIVDLLSDEGRIADMAMAVRKRVVEKLSWKSRGGMIISAYKPLLTHK